MPHLLRRMIDLAAEVKRLDHWVHLDVGFRSDLAWWSCFVDSWNGRSLMEVLAPRGFPDVSLHLMRREAGGLVQSGAVIGITSHGMASGGLSASLSRRCCR